jgi:DNA-binding MarR family transcriptional regulator
MSVSDNATAIRGAVTRLSRRLRAERPPGALSGNKLSVLSHLYRNGPTTPGVVAAAEHQQPQSLSRTFTELQLAGLVTRRPSEQDRRQSVLTITTAGVDALTRDMADRDAWLAEALGSLTDTEADFLRIAAALMDRLADSSTAARRPADRQRTA